MPLPLIPLAFLILEIAVTALAAYEALEVIQDLYDGIDKYNKSIDKAKEEIKAVLEKLKSEIDQKIDEKQEVSFLMAAAGADPQGPHTRKASGAGSGSTTINAAIEQKIPFRQVITMVCDKADALPVLNLRRKTGVQLKDLPKAKRKALEALLEKGFEQITDQDLEHFIVVRLKQLAANFMFEFIDHCLDWRSPMKCEVSFGPKPSYADHPVENGTKLKRLGSINPFYPAPHRQQGSISADLVITEYRRKPCTKDNVFAIVEIKFPKDRIDEEQFRKYRLVLDAAAAPKTQSSSARFDNRPVSSGGRLSLFRYPLDRAEERKNQEQPRSSTSSRTRKAK
jgi:hypothetical protein